MAPRKLYSNPTVKTVVFEIRFPNLFYIESKIGEIQIKIMKEFPESSLLFQRQFLIGMPIGQLAAGQENLMKEGNTEAVKIWQFRSPKKFILNIQSSSLSITSEFHKSYDIEGTDKFRDIIKYVLDSFLEINPIPIISRLGLRYIDECPIESKTNASFKAYYNTTFPLKRFDIGQATEMGFTTIVKRGDYLLRYAEVLQKKIDAEKYFLMLDFDGSAMNIKSEEYLNVADKLHDLIAKTFTDSIKAPVIAYMNQEKEKKK